ncbi:MAG: NAD(P)/FAD-dependent oxidoreductase [Gammaproteobacteria bacterium]
MSLTTPVAPGLPPAPVASGDAPLNIAVVGGGIAGLSAAWLLNQRHRVTVFESEPRPGGHSHTVDAPATGGGHVPVDTGFIVYNEPSYPNLTALFAHLEVPTVASDMSFAVSQDGGALEYAGTDLQGLFAQPRNLLRPRFWAMLRDLMRFYREAPPLAAQAGLQPLEEFLDAHGYGRAFREDHLYPMAAAIWSTPAGQVGRYPTEAFIRFCENHHLLQVNGRPVWRTVKGGSRAYVQRLTAGFRERMHLDQPVVALRRDDEGAWVRTAAGWWPERFDAVVVGAHADQALGMLQDPSEEESRLLGAFRYSRNHTVLHSDPALMPRRRAVWSSWNYLSDRRRPDGAPCVTYWMNRLQGIDEKTPLFVTLNPIVEPHGDHLIRTQVYEHPLFDARAIEAQRALWSIQGQRRVWYCGAYFGSGFHEDGLQSGLAVAEALGGVRRPWQVANESGRIHIGARPAEVAA